MDLILALGFVHVFGGLAWAAAVLVLALTLLTARRSDDAALRALPDVALMVRRALRPAILIAILSGVALASAGDFLSEAWVVLSAALGLSALVLGAFVVAPACERARAMPRGDALAQGRRARGLAALDLGVQSAAIGLTVLMPGWGGAAILAGLLACLVLAVALVRETAGDASPA